MADRCHPPAILVRFDAGRGIVRTDHLPSMTVADHLERYFDAGAHQITLRATSWDQRGQVDGFIRDVLPALRGRVGAAR